MTRQEVTEAVARGWCHPDCGNKVMDSVLAYAIVDEVCKSDTSSNLGCATTSELLKELLARVEVNGTADYRTVDSVV